MREPLPILLRTSIYRNNRTDMESIRRKPERTKQGSSETLRGDTCNFKMKHNHMTHISLEPDWIVGFTDAEGCFSVQNINRTIRCRFIITQHTRSKHVLLALQHFFKVGRVHKAGTNMWHYSVANLHELHTVILPFFTESAYSLRTVKYYSWLRLQSAVTRLIALPRAQRNSIRAEQLPLEHFKTALIPSRVMTAAWFRGFVDGEGCFTVAIVKQYPIPQFLIGVHKQDGAICYLIFHRTFLGCGVVYARKNGVMIYQLTRRNDLIAHLFPILYRSGNIHALCTSKRYCVSFFRRIVLAMASKTFKTQRLATMVNIVMWRTKWRSYSSKYKIKSDLL